MVSFSLVIVALQSSPWIMRMDHIISSWQLHLLPSSCMHYCIFSPFSWIIFDALHFQSFRLFFDMLPQIGIMLTMMDSVSCCYLYRLFTGFCFQLRNKRWVVVSVREPCHHSETCYKTGRKCRKRHALLRSNKGWINFEQSVQFQFSWDIQQYLLYTMSREKIMYTGKNIGLLQMVISTEGENGDGMLLCEVRSELTLTDAKFKSDNGSTLLFRCREVPQSRNQRRIYHRTMHMR
jgi:hypothetical protein